MTRQYKGMQEELLNRINKLEDTVQHLTDQLSESDNRQEKILKEKNAIIQMKDQEIFDLKARMDDMAEEFGEMLRETLEKMRERIEISSGSFDAPELPIQQRMEELKLAE
jgi:predicted RNase H-like nuclease (RuvC/YqgF family)